MRPHPKPSERIAAAIVVHDQEVLSTPREIAPQVQQDAMHAQALLRDVGLAMDFGHQV